MKLRDTAVRLRAPVTAGYGGQTQQPDWANAVEKTLKVAVQPISSEEETDQRQTTITRWRMFVGPDDDILATDRFRWAGRVLEVDGDVGQWRRGRGLHHLEVVLKAVSDDQVPA